jgi:NH3-dependent NAD+ synthetase
LFICLTIPVDQSHIPQSVKHLVLERRLESAQTVFFAIGDSGMVKMAKKARLLVESLKRQVTASAKKMAGLAVSLPSQDTVEYAVISQLSFLSEINDLLSQINIRREELRARRHVSNQLLPFGAPSSKSTRLKSMNR